VQGDVKDRGARPYLQFARVDFVNRLLAYSVIIRAHVTRWK
jgi:hypothetical protein